ncbi:MAG: SUMF1/EgtB/PvdO family nonheme iron enzyme, partial [Pirellulales bacterium]
YLLTGHAPFEDDQHNSTVSKMTAHVLDPVPNLKTLRTDVPDGVVAIFERLVAKQPADRFQDGTALAEALHPFASGNASAAQETPSSSPGSTVWRRSGEAATKMFTAGSGQGGLMAGDELNSRARSAKELLDLHCYQEVIALLEEVPNAENIPVVREILFEARQRQFEINNLLATIQQGMHRKDRQSRQQLQAALERLRVLKPGHKEFESHLARIQQAERGGLRLPLPGREEPLDIPWAAAIPALIVGGLMAVMGVWVIVRDKGGKEIARIEVPDGGSATVTADSGDSPNNAGGWHGWPADAPQPAIAPFDAAQAEIHQQAWADYLKLPLEHTNSLGMKFRLIPPGEFLMGSTTDEIDECLKDFPPDEDYWRKHFPSEAPRHKVILTKAIYMGVHQVTQENYEAVMGTNPSVFASTGRDPKKSEKVAGLDTAQHPVEGARWYDAVDFCAKLCEKESLTPFYARVENDVKMLSGNGYRLPTEAEWEFACRAGTITKYWIGDSDEDLKRIGWTGENSEIRTHPVGELPRNPLGLFDMHGNVWEWVEDGWDPTYYEQFDAVPAVDPSNPSSADSQRVMRGGNFNDGSRYARSATRGSFHASWGLNGFRVALTVDAVRQLLPK